MGLTFKGANAWPYFRSYRPGWFPWLVDEQEAGWLVLALEQLLDVAPRLKENRRLIARKPDTCTYLIRVFDSNGATGSWRDEYHEYRPPATTIQLQVPHEVLNAVRAMPPTNLTVEMDVTPSPFPIGKKGERPQMPYMLLAVDRASYFALGVELLTVEETIEDMWVKVPAKFLGMVVKNGMRPARVALRTPWVFMVMQGVCAELGIKIESDSQLPALAQVRRELERFNHRQ